MKLYLLRHGHAPTAAEAGVATDPERPLSDEGRRTVRRMAQELLRRGGRPALILHSPFRRAVETAQELQKLVKAPVLEAFSPLANAMPAEELQPRLQDRAAAIPELLLVGHQPQLGELAAYLSGSIFELRAGGLIALETREGKPARTLWTCNPGDWEGA